MSGIQLTFLNRDELRDCSVDDHDFNLDMSILPYDTLVPCQCGLHVLKVRPTSDGLAFEGYEDE